MSNPRRTRRKAGRQRPAAAAPEVRRSPGRHPPGGPAGPAEGLAPWRRAMIVTVSALGMLGLVFVVAWLVFRNHLAYDFYDITDIGLYFDYARRISHGFRPYVDFPFEYPPLAVSLFTIPVNRTDAPGYASQFVTEMLVAVALTAVAVALAAASIWRGLARPMAASAAYAMSVAFIGAVIANRYDAVVALLVALLLLLLARGAWVGAALALGLGFALKLTPAVLLPLVLLLARAPRRIAWCGGAFVLAAVLPWVPYLAHGRGGLLYVFAYHMKRPLQIESVLATPYWIGHLAGRVPIRIGTAFGSQSLFASGAEEVARASLWLMAAGLGTVYALIWRRRETLRSDPRQVPLAALAVILAFMSFGKVLSPQFFIWALPAIALVTVDRRALGALALGVVLLTGIEFPGQYWQFTDMRALSVALVVARNLCLVAAFAVSVVALARLPEPASPPRGEVGSSVQ